STDTSGTSGSTDTSGTSGSTDTSGTGGSTDTSGTSGSTDTSGTGGSQPQMVFDDYVLDIATLSNNEQTSLIGDAAIVNTASGSAIQFDGNRDMVKLGRLAEFEDSEQIAFTVEFTRDEADGSSQRLVWNKGNFGLAVSRDGLIAYVANNDGKFTKGFRADNIGLNDTDAHQITLMVDQVSDHLQVVVDGAVVIDETNTDFDFIDANGGEEWEWTLGTANNRFVDGEISAFAIDDDVQFIDIQAAQAEDLFG
ncbi:hypothetical protein, partial [Sulfitobacter sp. MF3-043]|uniref:hypothetical protein n=1 Tax=Sulfitobacter sediminivivens TaxID=3252902 RepID=UPI003EBC5926